MNLKRIGQSVLWIIAGILLLSFLWQYVQRRGGLGAVFGQLFPGLTGGIWHGSVGRQPAPAPAPPVQMPIEDEVAPRPAPLPAPAPPRTPPVVVPAPPTAPQPVHPEADPSISMNDRLPWENNRVRSEVINALTRDIARVQGMERQWADTMPEVIAVGGKDNYLNLQRDRLTRARTFPATARVSPAPRVGGVPAPTPQPSPLTPAPEVHILPRVAPAPPITVLTPPTTTFQPAAGRETVPVMTITPMPLPVTNGSGASSRIWDEPMFPELLQ
mgnify:CR=1 FL=1